MKKLLCLLGFFIASVAHSEPLKQVFNPFTNKPDYITRIDSNTVQPGPNCTSTSLSTGAVVINCTSSGSSGGGGYNVEPATVTFTIPQGLVTSTFTMTGGTSTINGVKMIWPTSSTVGQFMMVVSTNNIGWGNPLNNLTASGQAVLSGSNIGVGPTSLSTGTVGTLSITNTNLTASGQAVLAGSNVGVGPTSLSTGTVGTLSISNTALTASGQAVLTGNNVGVGPTSLSTGTVGTLSIANTNLTAAGAAVLSGTSIGVGQISLSTAAIGTLQAAQEPAHTGDVTNSAGSLAMTLAAVINATHTWTGSTTFQSSTTFTSTVFAPTGTIFNVPGNIQQIIVSTTALATSTASGCPSYINTTLQATISPKNSTDKIIVISVNQVADNTLNDGARITHSGTGITDAEQIESDSVASGRAGITLIDVASPATTSATIYKVQMCANGGTATHNSDPAFVSKMILIDVGN